MEERPLAPTDEEVAQLQEAQYQHVYEVQPGDTLSDIAGHFGTTVEDFVKQNNIRNPNRIFPGQKFAIPGREPPPPKPEQVFEPPKPALPEIEEPKNEEGKPMRLAFSTGDPKTDPKPQTGEIMVVSEKQFQEMQKPKIETKEDDEFARMTFLPLGRDMKTGETSFAMPKMVYDAVEGFRKIMSGEIPMYVDNPDNPGTAMLNPEAVNVGTAVAGLSMTGGLAGTGGKTADDIAKAAVASREAAQASPTATTTIAKSMTPGMPMPTEAMQRRLQQGLKARKNPNTRAEFEEGLEWSPTKVYNLKNEREFDPDPSLGTGTKGDLGSARPDPVLPDGNINPDFFVKEFRDELGRLEPKMTTLGSGFTKSGSKPKLDQWKGYTKEDGTLVMSYDIDSKTKTSMTFGLNRMDDGLTTIVDFHTVKEGNMVPTGSPLGVNVGSKVLANVVDGVRQFVNAAQPKRLVFAAGSSNLIPLYQRMAKQLAKEFDGTVLTEADHGVAGFFMIDFPKSRTWFKEVYNELE